MTARNDSFLFRTCCLCGGGYFFLFKRRHLRRHVIELFRCPDCRGKDQAHRPCYHAFCLCKCSPVV